MHDITLVQGNQSMGHCYSMLFSCHSSDRFTCRWILIAHSMRISTKQSTPIKWYGFHWLSWAICKWAGVHSNLENIRSCQTLIRFMELISDRNPVLQIRLRHVESNCLNMEKHELHSNVQYQTLKSWMMMLMMMLLLVVVVVTMTMTMTMTLMSIAVLSYINLIIWRHFSRWAEWTAHKSLCKLDKVTKSAKCGWNTCGALEKQNTANYIMFI